MTNSTRVNRVFRAFTIALFVCGIAVGVEWAIVDSVEVSTAFFVGCIVANAITAAVAVGDVFLYILSRGDKAVPSGSPMLTPLVDLAVPIAYVPWSVVTIVAFIIMATGHPLLS